MGAQWLFHLKESSFFSVILHNNGLQNQRINNYFLNDSIKVPYIAVPQLLHFIDQLLKLERAGLYLSTDSIRF